MATYLGCPALGSICEKHVVRSSGRRFCGYGESFTKGVTLLSLRAEYPEADRLGQMLKVLGLDLAVTRGPKPALIATFDSPRGKVELRSDQM